jgi:hypothetical protein
MKFAKSHWRGGILKTISRPFLEQVTANQSLGILFKFGLLNGEIFCALKEIKVLAECWTSTTTPSDYAPRWATDHRRRKPGRQTAGGMEKWKRHRFPLLPTPTAAR